MAGQKHFEQTNNHRNQKIKKNGRPLELAENKMRGEGMCNDQHNTTKQNTILRGTKATVGKGRSGRQKSTHKEKQTESQIT